MIEEQKRYTQKRPIGIYDTNILCSACDNKLGVFDKYGVEVFLKKLPSKIEHLDTNLGACLQNVNYPQRLKLFILSVVWRFAISKFHDAADFTLPDKFHKRIREMLINDDAGGINDFSIFITRFKSSLELDEPMRKFFIAPRRCRIQGINYILLWIPNGYKLYIKMDNRLQLQQFLPITLREDYPVYILKNENFETSNELELFKKSAQ